MIGKLVILFAILAFAFAKPQVYPAYNYGSYSSGYPGFYGYSGNANPYSYGSYGTYGASPYNYGYGTEAHEEDWMNLFSKCAAQRLFIPKLIPHIDAMIYVDTDTLFLKPADELWNVFTKFNTSQISAMAPEDDNPNVSWYPRFAKHPFYGKFGLNSGVMLMNLTRMRNFGWVDYITPIMLKWKLYIPWGDQDIINIIFHYHERAVYVLSCRYNYRSDQCMYGDACSDATEHGVYVLHGSRGIFHNSKQPAFRAIYRAISEYEVGTDPSQVLIDMDKYLSEAPPSNCGYVLLAQRGL